MQKTNTQHSFTYNTALLQRCNMQDTTDPVDQFVNGNAITHAGIGTEEFGLLVEHDSEDDDAFPVVVYMQGKVFVGWHDCENAWGYIVA